MDAQALTEAFLALAKAFPTTVDLFLRANMTLKRSKSPSEARAFL